MILKWVFAVPVNESLIEVREWRSGARVWAANHLRPALEDVGPVRLVTAAVAAMADMSWPTVTVAGKMLLLRTNVLHPTTLLVEWLLTGV